MEFDEYVVDLNADCKCGCRDLHRFHNIYHFPNNYGASVVENPKRPGFDKGGYRALVIIFSDDVNYSKINLPMFNSNPVECAAWEETVKVLTRIHDI